jgi:ATP-dependent RNA helicase RhlE
MQFHELKLNDLLLQAVQKEGYTEPTPIQEQSIPHILDGRDVIGCAQTGTGKTAAFALPIIQRLGTNKRRRHIRVLVLSPTRELAAQIGEEFGKYSRQTPLKHTVIFGGVGQQPQVQAIRRGVDILVATPGRLLDLMNQGIVRLNTVEVFVLDEADRMLDMGFIHDVKRVIKVLPTERQTLLFSATMPQAIQELSKRILIDPVQVEVTPQASTVDKIDQSVFFVERTGKRNLLKHILSDPSVERVLVFTRTKHRANNLAKQLTRAQIPADAIHGDKSQTARTRALANFRNGKTRILVATDIAARGLDIDAVTHVINFDLPNEPESYVHRIGRTARAGASGIAYSFCAVDERKYLKDIEKLIRQKIPIIENHPFVSDVVDPEPPKRDSTPDKNSRRAGQRRNRRRNNRQNKRRSSES